MIRQIELTPSREQAGVMKTIRVVEDEHSFTPSNSIRFGSTALCLAPCLRTWNERHQRRLVPLLLIVRAAAPVPHRTP